MENKIGIIGGGQLALMLIQSASKFGIECICLDPNPNSPAFKFSSEKIISSFSNKDALEYLASKVDIILFEFENINIDALNDIDKNKFITDYDILKISQNRIIEKTFAINNGFDTAKFFNINSEDDLKEAINNISYGGILKTAENGYDGKGQLLINNENDIFKAKDLLEFQCIYEEKVDFDFEMSIIAVRSKEEIEFFPPFFNEHINGILHKTYLNEDLSSTIKEEALTKTKELMINNDIYGILCIEFFVKDNKLYFNELAPRPHNSGHVSMDALNVSQFDQYIRAAINFKLIKPKIIRNMSMINILGQHYKKALQISSTNDLDIYLYGKDSNLKNRKVGHINIDSEDLTNKINKEFLDVK